VDQNWLLRQQTVTREQKRQRFLGVAHLFDVIIGGDDIENSKPAPDMVLEAGKQTTGYDRSENFGTSISKYFCRSRLDS
jgi:phosphoglycolate phosphatase-like HAD superfamily hydrolase